MTQTANRRRKVVMPSGIRKKFAAALCMLLVAAIMMVGSTYAWFTLSTAPEITGITTSIGANGNLEIALLNDTSIGSNADDLGIKSNVGDSMEIKSKPEANETWGNLVDLSDATYGLTQMILNPAALNFAGSTIAAGIAGGASSPLLAPNYGSDGRVIDVQKRTQDGKYDGTSRFLERGASASFGGVRVIGVSSGITLRISTYRNALASITTYMNAAKTSAQASLVNNGQQLASALVSYAADPAYKLTQADVDAMNGVLSELAAANAKVADAIRQAVLAHGLSAAHTGVEIDDATVTAYSTAVASAAITEEALTAAIGNFALTNEIKAAITAYASLSTAISNAQAKMADKDGDSSNGTSPVAENDTLESVSTIFNGLIDRDYVNINGIAGSTIDAEHIGDLASAILSSGNVVVTMLPGSGVYADLAQIVGNYTAAGLSLTLTYDQISVENMPTVMTTDVIGATAPKITPSYLDAAKGSIGNEAAASGATTIDDPYGYMIDFGFRTNAAGSNLLLDVAGSQRVYDDNFANLDTQGAGSYLEFTTADNVAFSLTDVKALMSAIRVVFVEYDPTLEYTEGTTARNGGYKILAVAAPEIYATVDNVTGEKTVDVGEGVTEVDANTVQARLALYNVGMTLVGNNEYRLNTLKAEDLKKTEGENPVKDYTITGLEQNKAKKISVLVYLDGDIVDNTFVANAEESMSGKLNLQFKSDADLKPMEVSSMRDASESNANQANQITVARLKQVATAIKKTATYTTASTATEPTTEQTALISAITAVEGLSDDLDLSVEENRTDVTNKATTLGQAYKAAGGYNPFA